MEQTKENKLTQQDTRPECHLSIGDISIQTFENIDTTCNYMLWLLQQNCIKEYLGVIAKKNIMKGASYID